jgi:hypothetical protein
VGGKRRACMVYLEALSVHNINWTLKKCAGRAALS